MLNISEVQQRLKTLATDGVVNKTAEELATELGITKVTLAKKLATMEEMGMVRKITGGRGGKLIGVKLSETKEKESPTPIKETPVAENSESEIVVLLDYDNFDYTIRNTGHSPSLGELMKYCRKFGKIVRAIAFLPPVNNAKRVHIVQELRNAGFSTMVGCYTKPQGGVHNVDELIKQEIDFHTSMTKLNVIVVSADADLVGEHMKMTIRNKTEKEIIPVKPVDTLPGFHHENPTKPIGMLATNKAGYQKPNNFRRPTMNRILSVGELRMIDAVNNFNNPHYCDAVDKHQIIRVIQALRGLRPNSFFGLIKQMVADRLYGVLDTYTISDTLTALIQAQRPVLLASDVNHKGATKTGYTVDRTHPLVTEATRI